jgi:hypothetical protein
LLQIKTEIYVDGLAFVFIFTQEPSFTKSGQLLPDNVSNYINEASIGTYYEARYSLVGFFGWVHCHCFRFWRRTLINRSKPSGYYMYSKGCHTKHSAFRPHILYIYIYIYLFIYMCVCACLCACVFFEKFLH